MLTELRPAAALATSHRYFFAVTLSVVLATTCHFSGCSKKHESRVTVVATVEIDLPEAYSRIERGSSSYHTLVELPRRWLILYVKNEDVLNASISSPQVKNLPLLEDCADPIAWLQSELQLGFDGEKQLTVGLSVPVDQTQQAARLIDEILKNYCDSAPQAWQTTLLAVLDEERQSLASTNETLNELDKQIESLQREQLVDNSVLSQLKSQQSEAESTATHAKEVFDTVKSNQQMPPPEVRILRSAAVAK